VKALGPADGGAAPSTADLQRTFKTTFGKRAPAASLVLQLFVVT
jgi:hypothetical protein